MNATQPAAPFGPGRIAANHEVTKRLGTWTTAREFRVRAHWRHAILGLRSPDIDAGEITGDLELDHAAVKLLVADDWDLRRLGRGRVKDAETRDATGSRRIVLAGRLRHGEVRVHRGGIAQPSAMFSREYQTGLRRAHGEGVFPAVDDPARTA